MSDKLIDLLFSPEPIKKIIGDPSIILGRQPVSKKEEAAEEEATEEELTEEAD